MAVRHTCQLVGQMYKAVKRMYDIPVSLEGSCSSISKFALGLKVLGFLLGCSSPLVSSTGLGCMLLCLLPYLHCLHPKEGSVFCKLAEEAERGLNAGTQMRSSILPGMTPY